MLKIVPIPFPIIFQGKIYKYLSIDSFSMIRFGINPLINKNLQYNISPKILINSQKLFVTKIIIQD